MAPDGSGHDSVLLAVLAASGGLAPRGESWARLLGWSLDELAGTTFVERVHPDDQDEVITAIHGAYLSGAPARFVCRYASKDGVYLRLHWLAAPRAGLVELDLSGGPAE